jgi:hypothetical protein
MKHLSERTGREILLPHESSGKRENRYYGIATFSRFPIVRKGEIIHPGSSSLSIFTDVIIVRTHSVF